MSRPANRPPHEPPLAPEVARANGLRTGWTTGTCASAAAKAAVMGLLQGRPPAEVEVGLPGGRRVRFAVTDVTRPPRPGRRRQGRRRRPRRHPRRPRHRDRRVAAGRAARGHGRAARRAGRGHVTLPGLGLPVGAPAINPVPARMIRAAVGRADRPSGGAHDLGARGRGHGGPHLQRPPRHRRRDQHPGHHRDRAAVLDGGVAGQRGPAGRRGRGPGPGSHRALDRRTHRRGRPAAAPGPAGRVLRRGRRLHRHRPAAGRGRRAWPG